MKIKRIHIVLCLIVIALVLLAALTPKDINWTPSFEKKDKIPYGAYVLRERLRDIFPTGKVDDATEGFYLFHENNYDTSGNYLIITSQLEAGDLDLRTMTEYAAAGNNIFIAAYALPQQLADTLGIELTNSAQIYDTAGYVANFKDQSLHTITGYQFGHEFLAMDIVDADVGKGSFLLGDSSARNIVLRPRTILGIDSKGKANFVRIPFGKGAFYIHSFPIAFTNYHMLKNGNDEYVSKCLSFLPDQPTHWDDYYKPMRTIKAQTPLRYILSTPAYFWAFWTAITGLFLYMIFASKRVQRIIPTIIPPANMSLQFTRTIGSLYYQQRDHRDIAMKKWIYLMEKIRQQYYLQTVDTSEAFRQRLAYKSNVSKETIDTMFHIYENEVRRVRHIDERTLIAFNTAMEQFYKESGLTNK